jgi:hypothetical protein
MKTNTQRLYSAFIACVIFLLPVAAAAQVTVTGSSGVDGTYTSLTQAGGAFAAINASAGQAGNIITITITADITTEDGANALQNKLWIALQIVPSGARTVSGSANSGLIRLDDADNVLINGLNSGGNSLIIQNTNTGNAAAAISFINSASFNIVKNCTLKGSGVGATTTGVVFFVTSTSGLGNSNNTFDNCDITAAGSNLPSNGVYSSGSSNFPNVSDTIRNCRIYDNFNSSNNSAGIQLGVNNSAWVIDNNRFYQTATRTTSSGTPLYAGVYLNNTVGDKFVITNNYIGGNDAAGNNYSVYGSTSTSPQFKGIVLANTGPIVASLPSSTLVQYNRIRGINISSGRVNTAAGNNIFVGIELSNGTTTDSVKVLNNVIGGISGNDSILITTSTGSANVPCVGIYNRSTRGNVIDGNTIGAIRMIESLAGRTTAFVGIKSDVTSNSNTIQIRNNSIGNSDLSNSISSSYTGSGGNIVGIQLGVSGSAAIYNVYKNSIRNLNHTGANAFTGSNASVMGIQFINSSADQSTISNNTIYKLANTATTSSALEVTGIRLLGQTGGLAQPSHVNNNWIYDLEIANSTSVTSAVYGIRTGSGSTAYFYNNMISLGSNTPGAVYGADVSVISNTKVYNNSFRVTGATANGESAAFFRSTNNTQDVKNNIFYNDRAAGTGNYAIKFTSTPSSTFTYNGNNNLFFSTGTNLAIIVATTYTTLANFQTAVNAVTGNSEGAGSKTAAVTFVSTTDLHTFDTDVLNAGTNLSAATPAIMSDFDEQFRNGSCTDIGADEIVFSTVANTYTWTGFVDTKWCVACNWDRGIAPTASDNADIPAGFTNYPVLNTAASCGTNAITDVDIKSGGSLSIGTGGFLIVFGNFNNSGTFSHTDGDVSLNGTTTQNLTTSSPSLTFYNLTVDGSGNKQLFSNVTVNGLLTFTNGNITISIYSLTAAAVAGGSVSSHAVTNSSGALIIKNIGAGMVDFPVGHDATHWNKLSIANGNNRDWSVNVESGINPNTIFDQLKAINRTWHITPLVNPPGLNPTIRFYFANADGNAGFNPAGAMEIGDYYLGAWTIPDFNLTIQGTDPDRYIESVGNISNFSPFVIGNLSTILSIGNSISFDAREAGNLTLLNWQMGSITSVLSFEVMRSYDGVNFQKIATVDALAGALNYRFTDAMATGRRYYRIKVLGRSGNVFYSRTVAITGKQNEVLMTGMVPTLVTDRALLTIAASRAATVNLLITDMQGRVVKTMTQQLSPGNTDIDLELGQLAAGSYQLTGFTANGKIGVIRFVKQ